MKSRRFSGILFACVLAAFAASTALACTPLGVGAKASTDGSVIVSHTCDGWYDHRIRIVPGGEHKSYDALSYDLWAGLPVT